MATKSVKKSTTKKAPARTATKTRVKHASAKPVVRSFVPTPATEPFLTLRISNQTVYWLILSSIVLGLALWVTSINIKVQEIYDSIDASLLMSERMDDSLKRAQN